MRWKWCHEFTNLSYEDAEVVEDAAASSDAAVENYEIAGLEFHILHYSRPHHQLNENQNQLRIHKNEEVNSRRAISGLCQHNYLMIIHLKRQKIPRLAFSCNPPNMCICIPDL